MRRLILRIEICCILLLVVARAHAQPTTPSERLAEVHPELFSVSNLVDAAVGGELGARLVETTPAQRSLGFEPEDVIVAVEGQQLGVDDWSSDAVRRARSERSDAIVFTVWRTVPGDRPVLAPAHLGRQVIEEFTTLPAPERTPMRLALMLANQSTLVKDGLGVLVVPAPTPHDDSVWLRVANPLPPASEFALRDVAKAVMKRVRMSPPSSGSEQEAARQALERGRFLEAEERARRAMVLAVLDPTTRHDPTTLEAATLIYIKAISDAWSRRAELLAHQERLALVVEGRFNGVQAFLPQNTLLLLDPSYGYGFGVGLQLRMVSSFFLIGNFGFVHNRFGGDNLPQTDREQMALETRLLEWTLGSLYRVRVASRLRPFFRAGAGLYSLRARVECGGSNDPDRIERTAARKTSVGFTLGGGMDVMHWKSSGLRASVMGSYRILKYRFGGNDAPQWEECERITGRYFPTLELDLKDGYMLDMDGWQLGFLWSLAL